MTRLRVRRSGIGMPIDKIWNFFLQKFQTTPPSLLFNAAKTSTVYNAEITIKQSYNFFPPDAFVVCVRENFTFPFRLLPLSKASEDFSRI